MPNSLARDQVWHSVGPDLGPNCLQRLSADDKTLNLFFSDILSFATLELVKRGNIMYPSATMFDNLKTFRCGGCNIFYESIYILHDHLRDHIEGGSYKYNHKIHTAFPVPISKDATTQTSSSETEEKVFGNDIEMIQTSSSDKENASAEDGVVMSDQICVSDRNDTIAREEVNTNLDVENNKELDSYYDDNYSSDTEIDESFEGNGDDSVSGVASIPTTSSLSKTDTSLSDSIQRSSSVDQNPQEFKPQIKIESGKYTENTFKGIHKDLRVSLCGVDCHGSKYTKLEDRVIPKTDLNWHSDMESCNTYDGKQICVTQQKIDMDTGTTNMFVSLRREKPPQKDKIDGRSGAKIVVDSKLKAECAKCGIYIRRKNMNRHLLEVHNELPVSKPRVDPENTCQVYKCGTCGKVVNKKIRKQHEKTHRRVEEFEPAVCEVCGKVFPNSKALKCHKSAHLDLSERLKCNRCDFVATSLEAISLHKKKHRGDHACQVCGAVLSTAKHVLFHVRTVHMGEKRFQCDICDKKFSGKVPMLDHRATHFEPTLSCTYCGKLFKSNCSLRKHVKIHTGDKRYTCYICNHSYVQSTPYWLHMEKKHSISKAEAVAMRQSMLTAENEMQEQRAHEFKDSYRPPDKSV